MSSNAFTKGIFSEFEITIKEKIKITYTELMRNVDQSFDLKESGNFDECEKAMRERLKESFITLTKDIEDSFKIIGVNMRNNKASNQQTTRKKKSITFYLDKTIMWDMVFF